MMINNSSIINKTNNHLYINSLNIEKYHDIGTNCGGVKPVNEPSPLDNWISNGNA
jgi:hypothetical protein